MAYRGGTDRAGRIARIAPVHQYSSNDRVERGAKQVRYARREPLDSTANERELIYPTAQPPQGLIRPKKLDAPCILCILTLHLYTLYT